MNVEIKSLTHAEREKAEKVNFRTLGIGERKVKAPELCATLSYELQYVVSGFHLFGARQNTANCVQY